MMIIDGPDRAMRAALLTKLMRVAERFGHEDEVRFFTSGDGVRCDLSYLLAFVHVDHRLLVRDGWPSTGDPVEDQMLRYALCNGGSVVAWCGPARVDDEVLPTHWCEPGRDLEELAYHLLNQWSRQRGLWTPLFAYGGVGEVEGNPIMLVGESYNPFVPADHDRRLAFTARSGACHFLHRAIRYNRPQPYYVTNATKYDKPRLDLEALRHEIDAVVPSKIVAMGNEAAALLAKTQHCFRLTYHPQYWHRFRHDKHVELARDISLTKTTV